MFRPWRDNEAQPELNEKEGWKYAKRQ